MDSSNIYIGHSTLIDFREDLYKPLRKSRLDNDHNIILPHENSDIPFRSKDFLKDECDLFIAEVSKASTGLGIELGWANLFDVPVLCMYKEGSTVSSAVPAVFDTVLEYGDEKELIEKII